MVLIYDMYLLRTRRLSFGLTYILADPKFDCDMVFSKWSLSHVFVAFHAHKSEARPQNNWRSHDHNSHHVGQ